MPAVAPLIKIIAVLGFAAYHLLTSRRGSSAIEEEDELLALSSGSAWLELWRGDGVVLVVQISASGHGARLLVRSDLQNVSLDADLRRMVLFEAMLPGAARVEGSVTTGDVEFDERILVGGEAVDVAAALDARTRAGLRALVDGSHHPPLGKGSKVSLSLWRERILKEYPWLVDFARRFSHRRTTEEKRDALLTSFRRDPDAGVKRRNLELAVRYFGSEDVVLRTLLEALAHPDPELRLLAASHAPVERTLELVSSTAGDFRPLLATDESTVHAALLELAHGAYPATLRARAIRSLLRRPGPVPDLHRHLLQLFADPSPEVKTAAFEELSARGWQPDVGGAVSLANTEGGELSVTDSEPHEAAEKT